MRFFNKLALCAAALGLLAAGAALPAAAAPAQTAAAIQLPSISWPWDTKVAAESIETGDYAATMTVGETQQLSPVLTPEDTTDTVSFASEDESIAAVSSSGLVQAVAAGTVRVAAAAGDAVTYYTITVQPDSSTLVSEMDITLAANQIAVGDTTQVSVQVLPSNATNTSELTLSSSDPSVATVNSFGKVTGVAAGTATITASCGSVSASAKITVSSSTASSESITLNTNYVVLKPGGTATLKASVSPSSAVQSVTYKTGDSSVAAVSSAGVITATGTGATSIIVSNGTASALVTVIVNRAATASSAGTSADTPAEDPTTTDPAVQAIESAAGSEVTLQQSEVPTLTSDILNALRTSGKTLIVDAGSYTLRIDGAALASTSAELSTELSFASSDLGMEFELTSSTDSLPADIEISLTGDAASYKRLYLYNSASGKWQYLNSYADGTITADTTGRYLLTNQTLNTIQVNWYFIGAAGVVLVAIIVAYIVFKKRYWFW